MISKTLMRQIFFLALLAMFIAFPALAAKVLRVIDGDTIELENGEKIRLIGIDCQENATQRDESPFVGDKAIAFMNDLVLGRDVRLLYDIDRIDRYGRTLAYVYVGSTFVNAELVRLGYARIMTVAPNTKHKDLLAGLQGGAQAKKLGLWNTQDTANAHRSGQSASSAPSRASDSSAEVFITNTGKKYHRAGCPHLAKSAIPVTEQDALSRGYTPCKTCFAQ